MNGAGTGVSPDASDVREMVERAARGESAAWSALVDRFSPMVWRLACWMCRSTTDGADVHQTVWLRLIENVDTLKHPERVGAWLVTTTRRECLRVIDKSSRVRLTGDERDLDVVDLRTAPDARLLADERDASLWDAFASLPESGRQLLTLLMVEPPISYHDISVALEMPIGSIGPTRARLLAKLRTNVAQRGVTAEDGHLRIMNRPA
jgi:RNA polymerase sigma factor (sigma-70 family)